MLCCVVLCCVVLCCVVLCCVVLCCVVLCCVVALRSVAVCCVTTRANTAGGAVVLVSKITKQDGRGGLSTYLLQGFPETVTI